VPRPNYSGFFGSLARHYRANTPSATPSCQLDRRDTAMPPYLARHHHASEPKKPEWFGLAAAFSLRHCSWRIWCDSHLHSVRLGYHAISTSVTDLCVVNFFPSFPHFHIYSCTYNSNMKQISSTYSHTYSPHFPCSPTYFT
jgi:hypothetical protein